MTPKQILDSFSETLMQDERILSSQERALVATLLQHAKSATNEDQKTQDAVRAVIASAVGETVAQRAFVVLGGSIVDRILDSSSLPQTDWSGRTTEYAGPKTPKEPDPPGVRAPKQPVRDTPVSPPPTGPKDPDPPGVRAPHKPMRDTPVSPSANGTERTGSTRSSGAWETDAGHAGFSAGQAEGARPTEWDSHDRDIRNPRRRCAASGSFASQVCGAG